MKLPKSFYFYLLEPCELIRYGTILKAERIENGYVVYSYGDLLAYKYKIPQKKITKRFILKLSKSIYYKEKVEGIYLHADTKEELLKAMKLKKNTLIRIYG
jgi:hypothetical protein